MKKRITVDAEARRQYAGLYLMRLLRQSSRDAEAMFSEDEELLQPLLTWLVERDYVAITDDDHLQLTPKGADAARQFEQRFERFLNEDDVFCAVDLEAGEFAFARYDEFPDAEAWQRFLSQDRFEDLRVAVAMYEGRDPVEVVFMSLVNEDQFGRDGHGWSHDLLLGRIWDDIADVCNTALKVEDLGYDAEGEHISAEVVIRDIIAQGRALMREMR